MKLRYGALMLALALCALCAFGCGAQQGDYLAPLSGAFCAELAGSFRGVAFSALLECAAPNAQGARAATLIFYAPAELKGTVVSQNEAGECAISAGGVTLVCKAAEGYLPLLTLFPAAPTVSEVTLEGELTCVRGEGFAVFFYPDGTPAKVENAAVCADVVRFSR